MATETYDEIVLKQVETYDYNNDGQISQVKTKGFTQSMLDSYTAGQLHASNMVDLSESSYFYDLAGRIDNLVYSQENLVAGATGTASYTHEYNYEYEAREQYLERRVSGNNLRSANGSFDPASTLSQYDTEGNRSG